MAESKEKFIGFIDILGFKRLVEEAEAGVGLSMDEIAALLKLLGTSSDRKKYENRGPHVCPQSQRIDNDLDFRLTQVSDCAIVSAEISPAGAINLIGDCWGAVIKLLQHGIMCRGYITRGRIYHTDGQFLGTGYQSALAAESEVSAFKRDADERGTPFVEVAPTVCEYIAAQGDACIKEMFGRMTESDGETVALYPFKRLSHSFMITSDFDPEREKRSNNNLKKMLETMKERVRSFVDVSNPAAVRKAEHYIAALDKQLAVCDRTDEMIDKLCQPISLPLRHF